jgi:hypothetical protein
LVDLFTWLHYSAPSTVVVTWFTGVDFSFTDKQGVIHAVPLGLYGTYPNTDKRLYIDHCPYIAGVAGYHTIAQDFASVAGSACY